MWRMTYSTIPSSKLVCVLVGALCAYTVGAANPKDKAAPPKKDVEPAVLDVKEIELSKIYSTSGQTKLRDVREPLPDDGAGRKALRALEDTLMTSKSEPLIGIVRGESISEAVIASSRLVGMKKPPKNAVGPNEKSTSSKHWLFVYIGAKHSSPSHWVVYPVQFAGKRIRFSVSVR